MKKYGLIGYPLSHSFSPKYFADKFSDLKIDNAEYTAYPIEQIEEYISILKKGVIGFNVTIPYKQQIIPFLDELSEEAKKVGAVNTVKLTDGRLVGYNTDVYGLEMSLKKLLGDIVVKKALVLGTGGAAKATLFVLDLMGIEATLISRKPSTDENVKIERSILSYQNLSKEAFLDHKLIINTTPLGMYPDVDKCPDIPYNYVDERFFAFDLVYNPKKTLFLRRIEKQGAKVMNGLQMLHDQADKAWQIWNQ